MGELLFHPSFKLRVTDGESLRIDGLLSALDRAIAAIEKSATVTRSPILDAAASIVLATRESLAAIDRMKFDLSPTGLDLLAKLMREIRSLLVVVRDLLLNGRVLPHRDGV